MGRSITHFMWGYQSHFRIERESIARKFFGALDKRFKPEVFLVGILAESKHGHFPACVEPEDDFWIDSENFNEVHGLLDELLKGYPESKILHSHELAQQHHNERLRGRSITDAVKQVIVEYPHKPPGTVYAVSFPAKVDCYWVCVVLGLQKNVIDTYYSLQQSSVNFHEYRTIPVATSLVDAGIHVFLESSTEDLQKVVPGRELTNKNFEELLRSAGDRLMKDAVLRIDNQRIEGMHTLFRSCNTISSLPYEQAAGSGSVIFAQKEHPAIKKKVRFASAAKLSSYRAARKLLELASDEMSLHSDSEDIFGLVAIDGYQEDDENVFEMIVLGHHHWELRHAGHAMMRVQYGIPRLPRPSFEDEKLHLDLPRIFPDINDAEIEKLIELVRVAKEEPHGTMIVITEEAAGEANRLKNEGISVEPFPLTPEIFCHLITIDGAVILSAQGVCHAIGTILDGKATDKGDSGRGARYNSAVRYVNSRAAPCLAIVFSEDKGVDFVPDLKPPINRAIIDQVISNLEGMLNSKRTNRREYILLMDWLDGHRFYLRQEDCEVLNDLVDKLEDMFGAEDESAIRIKRTEFMPDPEMNESLYYTK